VCSSDLSDENFLREFDGSATFSFSPGRGFWAISPTSWSVQRNVQTVTLFTDEQVGPNTVLRLRPGWNIISNPFGRDIAWADVQAANGGSLQPIWSFDGSFSEAATFTSAASGEAFYLNNLEGSTDLVLPYPSGGGAATTAASTTTSASSWFSLTATTSGPAQPSTVEFGVSKTALNGVDRLDVIAPPPSFESVSLLVTANDAKAGARQRLLKRSVRAPSADGHAYDLDLRAEPGTIVELSADNLPPSQAVLLVNRANGETVNLKTESSVTWTVQSEATALSLIAGTEAFVKAEQERLLPEELTLWPNYPNPFSRTTTIEYTIPKDANVQLQVYDILGRRVATLVDERQASGLHTVQWNGTGGSGQPLASGIYFGRIIVDGQTATRKMTLVR